jgi:hypothetical protein
MTPFHEGAAGYLKWAGLLAPESTKRVTFPSLGQWLPDALISYSGGTATELHRLPY